MKIRKFHFFSLLYDKMQFASFEQMYSPVNLKFFLRWSNNILFIHLSIYLHLSLVDYLLITPWENGIKMEETNIPHWNPFNGKPNQRSLEMGHRGCGSTNGQNRLACFIK